MNDSMWDILAGGMVGGGIGGTLGAISQAPRNVAFQAMGYTPEQAQGNKLLAALFGNSPDDPINKSLGFLAEMATDPLTYAGMGLGAATNNARGQMYRRAAQEAENYELGNVSRAVAANTAADASNAARGVNLLPEEFAYAKTKAQIQPTRPRFYSSNNPQTIPVAGYGSSRVDSNRIAQQAKDVYEENMQNVPAAERAAFDAKSAIGRASSGRDVTRELQDRLKMMADLNRNRQAANAGVETQFGPYTSPLGNTANIDIPINAPRDDVALGFGNILPSSNPLKQIPAASMFPVEASPILAQMPQEIRDRFLADAIESRRLSPEVVATILGAAGLGSAAGAGYSLYNANQQR